MNKLILTIPTHDLQYLQASGLVKVVPLGGTDYELIFNEFGQMWYFASCHFEGDTEAMKEALANSF